MLVRLKGKTVDTDRLTYEEMIGLQLELDEAIAQVKEQLYQAKVTFHQTGERADPLWFQRATRAQKAMQRARQDLQLLTRQKKRHAGRSEKTLPDFFMDVAREYLPRDTFEQFLLLARTRQDTVQRGGVLEAKKDISDVG